MRFSFPIKSALPPDLKARNEYMPFLRASPLLLIGSFALSACGTSLRQPSIIIQEKTMNTPNVAHAPQPRKYYGDGSKPFTISEIEDRILRVFSLPPDKINKNAVENIFGVILKGSEIDSYYEEISDDKQIAFAIQFSKISSEKSWLAYTIHGKKIKNGIKTLDADPKEIPDIYKLNYLNFVEKLTQLGWKADGAFSDRGNFFKFYKKNDYDIEILIDGFEGKPPYDYSKSKIYKIVIEKN